MVDVVLGANGAVVRLDPDEVREMERIGFLVKDSFRGKAPDFWSLRDFQPRNWFSEPVDSFYGMSVAGFTAPASTGLPPTSSTPRHCVVVSRRRSPPSLVSLHRTTGRRQ